MLWRDTVDLIAVSHSAGPNVVVTETSRTVFANKIGVVRNEFYQALANNLRPTATFVINAIEYEDEQKLRHDSKDYLVIRSYSKDGDTLELVCQAYTDVQPNLARLRDMVEIWHYVLFENSMGKMSPTPELLCTVPAQIDSKGGGTSDVDGVVETKNNYTVTIAYRADIRQDMFLMIGGARYDIRYIEDPFNRHETLILTVEKVVP